MPRPKITFRYADKRLNLSSREFRKIFSREVPTRIAGPKMFCSFTICAILSVFLISGINFLLIEIFPDTELKTILFFAVSMLVFGSIVIFHASWYIAPAFRQALRDRGHDICIYCGYLITEKLNLTHCPCGAEHIPLNGTTQSQIYPEPLPSDAPPQKISLLLKIAAAISYTLLFGAGTIVLLSSIYVLFIADPSETTPDSMNRNTPLLQRILSVLFIIGVMIFGYFANRSVWGAFKKHWNQPRNQ